jgi:hypothetical protein
MQERRAVYAARVLVNGCTAPAGEMGASEPLD